MMHAAWSAAERCVQRAQRARYGQRYALLLGEIEQRELADPLGEVRALGLVLVSEPPFLL
jgi:hypothetical protein